MKDLGELFSLMEKIDPQYKKYALIKREIDEARRDEFSYNQLDEYFKEDDFIGAYGYCLKNLGICIGEGSSRAVFQIDDAKCLKIARNRKGIQQNKVEAETNKSNCLLFPLVFYTSENNFWIETEYVLPARESDFWHCLKMQWIDFLDFVEILNYQKYSKYKDRGLMRQINDDETGMLKNIYDYVINKRIPVGDMMRICNWGMTKRNGKDTLVLLDSGWNKETMKMYGGDVSTSRSHYSDKVSYDSSD